MFVFDFDGIQFTWHQKLKPLYRGRFSQTYLLKSNNNRCLLKKYSPVKNNVDFEEKRFKEQATICSKLYPNEPVLNIENEWGIFFARPYYEGITLEQYKSDEQQTIVLLIAILSEINRLHRLGFLHTDIKPSNFLVDKNFKVKILDLGNCIPVPFKKQDMYVIPFTMIYAPPEMVLNFYDLCNESSDWYMWGLLAYFLLTRKPPYDHCNPVILMHQQINAFPDYERIKNNEWKDIIKKATYKEIFKRPPHRMTIEEIREHLKNSISIRKKFFEQTGLNV